jgi:hypothetical protein
MGIGQVLSNEPYEREKHKIISNVHVYGTHLKDVPKVFQAVAYNQHASASSVSLAAHLDPMFTDFVDNAGWYNEFFVMYDRGFQHIPERYADEYIAQDIALNTKVCSVDYTNDPDGRVTIRTANWKESA